ncbi:MAG: hypothetical protein DRJ42_29665 [Deltaproteobacteria bacterium]|nr:MAG: hypothetical protein DRJ42_29665 [Deltaproteobacteria bacterium]
MDDAYALEEADRAIVSAELSEGVEDPDEVRNAWVKVAVERLERHERGEAGQTQSLDEVEAALRDSIKER